MAELLFSLFFVLFAVVAVQNHTGVVAKRVVGLVWRQFANRQMDSNQNAPTSVSVDKSTQAHTIPTSESWQMFAQNTPTSCCQANNSRLNNAKWQSAFSHNAPTNNVLAVQSTSATFNKSIAQNSTISKNFGAQVAKHTVLQQKKRLEQSNRFVLRSTLR